MLSIPIPMVNVLNGGVHADNPLEIQEFMLVPQNFRSFSDSIRAVCECFYELKSILMSENLSTNVGDEGGIAPNISSHEKAFEFLVSAIRKAGYVPGEQMKIAIDAAAMTVFFHTIFPSEIFGQRVYRQTAGGCKPPNIFSISNSSEKVNP